jgi:hypothetical protein
MALINGAVIPEHIRRLMSPADRQPMGKAAMTMPEITAKAAAKLERQLHDQIADYLRMKGIRIAIHSRMDKRPTNQVGTPDFLFAYHRRPVAVEVKRPGCKPTEDQARIMRQMAEDGWMVRVVHGVEDVKSLLHMIEDLWP